VKLTEHRHSCGKRKLRERETVSVSYDTLRCIYIYIYININKRRDSIGNDEPMNWFFSDATLNKV